MSNMDLWSAVEKTDPKHVKAITGKAYKGNSPKPYYLVQRATETFGPCGIGWGFEIVDEKIIQGAMYEPGFFEQIHMARVKVWYKWNGERGEIEHVGQTLFSGQRKSGDRFTDEDAPKKSVTDALIKALSMIGFAGDIFMGRFDDSKYVEETAREFKNAPQAESPKTAKDAIPFGDDFPGDRPASRRLSPAQEYVIEAKRAVDAWTGGVDGLGKLWTDESRYRAEVGIVKGTPEYDELAAHFAAKGNSLKAKRAA